MPTINQILRHKRGVKRVRKPDPILKGNPQRRGVVMSTKTMKPRKPNSASRKVAQVRLLCGKKIYAYIPGEGHSLQEHAIVLVMGGGPNDLPGVNNTLVRGKYNLTGVLKRKNGRSKYAAPKN